jgi:hypothetical protein
MPKSTGRDYPLSPTPAFKPVGSDTTSNGGMTRKEYREEMRQAKYKHNIDAANKGTLASERIGKVKDVIGVVKDAVSTAASAKSLLTSSSPSRPSRPSTPDGGYRKKK